MNITVPDTLSSLAPWYTASMLAMLAAGVTAGMLISRSRLRDAAVIAAIVVKYHPEAATELRGLLPRRRRLYVWWRGLRMRINRQRAALTLAWHAIVVGPVVDTPEPQPAPEPKPRARDRFMPRPGEFPLLQNNPLVPLLTRQPCEPVTPRYREGTFVVTLKRGAFNGAAFLPA